MSTRYRSSPRTPEREPSEPQSASWRELQQRASSRFRWWTDASPSTQRWTGASPSTQRERASSPREWVIRLPLLLASAQNSWESSSAPGEPSSAWISPLRLSPPPAYGLQACGQLDAPLRSASRPRSRWSSGQTATSPAISRRTSSISASSQWSSVTSSSRILSRVRGHPTTARQGMHPASSGRARPGGNRARESLVQPTKWPPSIRGRGVVRRHSNLLIPRVPYYDTTTTEQPLLPPVGVSR